MQQASVSHYQFDTQQVRVVTREGEPWFVAADVCRCLVLHLNKAGHPNVTHTCAKLGAGEKGLHPIQTPSPSCPNFTTTAMLVSESGLYKLVMRSDKPAARKFQDWVTREVLPAIRKTGWYDVNRETAEPAAVRIENPPVVGTGLYQRQAEMLLRLAEIEWERTELLSAILRAGRQIDAHLTGGRALPSPSTLTRRGIG